MKKITPCQYQALVANGRILLAKPSGEAMVIQTADDCIVKKLSFRNNFLSRLFPRARRFARNSRRLMSLGLKTVAVKDVISYPAENCHIIVYSMVKGRPLSEYLASEKKVSAKNKILQSVASYYGQLHSKGIYCRPTHFRNIIVCPDESLALIDVQNIRFRFLSLDLWTRARNFKYILKHNNDMQHVISFGAGRFFETYMSFCRMNEGTRRIFITLLYWNVPGLFKTGTKQFLT